MSWLTPAVSGDLTPSDPQEHPSPLLPWRLTFSAPRYITGDFHPPALPKAAA
jgi:hypothetical protein